MKRSRSDAFDDKRVKRAIAINAKLRSSYPYKDFGTAYYRRGTPENISRFGSTYKEASDAQKSLRKDLGYVGRGMYMGGKGGYWGRKVGGMFGKAALGDKLGDIGSDLISQFVPGGATAMKAARMAGKVFEGRGMYNSVSNSLVSGGDPIPSFLASPDGSTITISHREYIGDIYAPPANDVFQNTAFSVNPGIERTFPWLSQIAQNYDEYTLHQCMFSYRSTVADFASASGQVGQVIMATIYNASSDPFSDKAQMMQYDASMSAKTSESMIHGVECDPAKLSGPVGRFVRCNPVLVGQDVNNYDHGLFNIAVTETPPTYANQAMGELWVSYTVQLRKPKFFTNRGLGISRDVFVCTVANNTNSPFGTTATPSHILFGQQNNIGTQFAQRDGSIVPINLPALNGDANHVTLPVSTGAEVSSFKITFPAGYTGNLRMELHFSVPIGSGQTGFFIAYGQGNIKPINDIFSTDLDGWKSYRVSGNNTSRTALQVWDIRVESAAQGVDNSIYFVMSGVANPVNSSLLDVSEYNHGLSYKQDGTRDQLILVDRAGTVQNI